jgi:hypothetical protein
LGACACAEGRSKAEVDAEQVGELMENTFEHAPELDIDSPAYDVVIRELDKIVYSDPEDVAEGLTLRDAFISIESHLGDFITIFDDKWEEKIKRISDALNLDLKSSTPIWKIVKDYESLMKVN